MASPETAAPAEPVLVTQPNEFPAEGRPEAEDMDAALEAMNEELQGKRMLEKPRVSKKTMVHCLREQSKLIAQLKRLVLSQVAEQRVRTDKAATIAHKMAERLAAADGKLHEADKRIAALEAIILGLNAKLEEAARYVDGMAE